MLLLLLLLLVVVVVVALLLGALEKMPKAAISIVKSLLPSFRMEKLGSHHMDFD
jgi:Sec-independent protein translocase protein TatA